MRQPAAGLAERQPRVVDIGFEGRVGRFDDYLQILTALLRNEHVTMAGRHYRVEDARLLIGPLWPTPGYGRWEKDAFVAGNPRAGHG